MWAAVSFDGSKQLYFIEEKENTDLYQEILDKCLSDKTRLRKGKLIFRHYNAPPHSALEIRGYFTDKLFNGHPRVKTIIRLKISERQ
jgi:hypothetical protein